MSAGLPALLSSLLNSPDPAANDRAWEAFVCEYSRLILHSIRRLGGDHDTVMDRYAFVLEQLREGDCRRLRTWAGDGRSQLTTWLVVVVQRLCLDHHRERYGRSRPTGSEATELRLQRRRLADLVAEELNPETTPPAAAGESGIDAELALRTMELNESLALSVSELSQHDQLLLTLRFREGLSAAEIARVTSAPTPFHVYRGLQRVLSNLQQALRKRGVEDPVP